MEQAVQEKVLGPLGPEDYCDSNPEFSVICSFISRFGSHTDLHLNIDELRTSLEDQEILNANLVDIHVKLFKKLRRYFVRDQWEKALVKFAYEYSYDHGYEFETMGYLRSRTSVKLQLLRRLLDAQFECDPKFKAAVNLIEANELRTKPAGRDFEGNTYWPCVDDYGSLRVYRDEPTQHKSWITICKDADDLKQLIEHLDATKDTKVKGETQPEPYNPYPEIFPEYFLKEDLIENNKEEVESKKAPRKGYGRKGKHRRNRTKKSESLLATVDEADETPVSVKDASVDEHTKSTHHECSRSVTSPIDSIESHVKYTIENILSKVASSFEYIFRSSPNPVKENIVKKETETQEPKSRKRTKREKPKIEVELPRRSSSRIQQLQQKKEEEEANKKQIAEIVRSSRVASESSDQPDSTKIRPVGKPHKSHKKDKQKWRNNKGKKRISWDKDDSDLSSTSSLTDSNDESFMEALDEVTNQDNDEDEFACEDEETNDEPVIIKRARTARQSLGLEETNDPNTSSIVEEDKPCGRCDKSDNPDWILLCDMCDDGYHTTCCVPPLMYVPDGDWFCPPCEQKMLILKLKEICEHVVELLATKERERLKRQKLRQQAPKKETIKLKINETAEKKQSKDTYNELNNPPKNKETRIDDLSESPSCDELPSSYRERSIRVPVKKRNKAKKKVKRIRYESEDDEDDDDDDDMGYSIKKTGGRYKNSYSRNIIDSESEELDDELDGEENFSDTSSDDGEQLKTRRARAFVSYKFEEYDELIQSAICGDSDAEVVDRNDEPGDTEPCNIGRGKDMATIEALAYQQENGLPSSELSPVKQQPRQRKKGRKLNDLDVESEIDIATSDESFQASSGTEDIEDEEDEDLTEVSTESDSSIDEIVSMYHSKSRDKKSKKKKRKRYDVDSDDSDFKPRSRRAATQKVSYKESTDEEGGKVDDDEEEYDPLVTDVDPEPVKMDPINELSQYCNQSSPSTPLFTSFKMSPRPQFYKEDEVRSLPLELDE